MLSSRSPPSPGPPPAAMSLNTKPNLPSGALRVTSSMPASWRAHLWHPKSTLHQFLPNFHRRPASGDSGELKVRPLDPGQQTELWSPQHRHACCQLHKLQAPSVENPLLASFVLKHYWSQSASISGTCYFAMLSLTSRNQLLKTYLKIKRIF